MERKDKKVLILTTIAGFLPQFEINNVKILQRLGYQVHYASNFVNPVYAIEPEELIEQGIILHQVDIHKSPVHIPENIKAFVQIKQLIEKEDIDFIHCHNPLGGVVGRLAAHHSKKKPYVVYTAHGFHFYEGAPIVNWLLFYTAERFLAKYTHQLITINKEDYQRAGKFKLAEGGYIDIIPGVGLNEQRYHKREAMNQPMREKISVPENAFHIVSVGELVVNKNHEIIIEALHQIEDREIYYSVCGEGPHKEYLEKLIQAYQLENRVRLLGYRTDVEDILQTADCFAFPSIREGFGMASVEALACEVPLIVSDNRGTREYAINGENSVVCHVDSVDEFKDAILYLMEHPDIRNRMSKSAGHTAEEFYISKTEEKMKEIYQRITNILYGA